MAVHAVIDALLGAAALGDIGSHFPDNDPRYKNADSIVLLKSVVEMISDKGYSIGNVDITIIAEHPRLAPYIDNMRNNMARVLLIDSENLSVKAATSEESIPPLKPIITFPKPFFST